MRKRLLASLLALCLLATFLPGTALAAGAQYDDIQGHWASKSIERWSEYNIVEGSDGHFQPDDALTRGQMAKILSNILGLTDQGTQNPFADVPDDAWYTPFVLRCYKAGIMQGDGTNAVPNDPISREAAMVMMCRALSIQPLEGDALSGYGDADKVSGWARGYVAAMTRAGIVNGVGDNMLAPAADINRAAIMTILDRTVTQYINAPGTYTLPEGEGLVLVAAGNVTLKGKTAANILVAPGASDKTVTFDAATVTGSITVQGDNTKVLNKNATLPKVVALGTGVTTENVKPSGGNSGSGNSGNGNSGSGNSGSGSGSGEGSSSTPSVTLTAAATGEGGKLAVGDKLTASVSNANGSTLVWNVGGFDRTDSATEYTVTAADLGKVIYVKLVKDGEQIAKSSEFTVANTTSFTYAIGDDTAPVVLDDGVTFKDDEGKDIPVEAGTELVLSVEQKTVTDEEATDTRNAVKEDVKTSVAKVINEGNPPAELSEDVVAALETALNASEVKAVDVDLAMVTTTPDEGTGESTTKTTAVHPVGKVTVKLSAAQLGLAGEDLNLYHLVASHTNANEEPQTVTGTVDEKGESVTFETNGLSTIWIGNVPPRTVSFDTDGGTAVDSQKVKFGSRVNTSKLPEKIEKSGFLFCGWNYDLTVTPIINNMTINAVWVAGSQVPESRITAQLSADESNVTLTTANGQVTAAANKDAESFTADLKVNLSVAGYPNAVKYGVSSAAQTAAALEVKDMTDVSGSVALDPVTVTDASGKVVAGKTSYYIKWVDANGQVLGVEELQVVVDNGQGAAESMTVTRNVNRGLGTFEPYMTSSTKTDAPKWVGYINGNLQPNYSDSSSEDYNLYFNVEFEDGHFQQVPNEETQQPEYVHEPKDYDILTLEFTPFTGESFDGKSISASFRYYNGDGWSELPCTQTLADGQLTVSLDTKTLNMPATRRFLDLILDLTVDGVEYRISFFLITNPNYTGTADGDMEEEEVYFTDMASLKAALAGAAEDKRWHITYKGAEPSFTISESIDIPMNCGIYFPCATVTVASGATVSMHSEENLSSWIDCTGTFTVNGKIVVDSVQNIGTTRHVTSIYCGQTTLASGGGIEVKDGATLSLRGESNADSTCTLEAGSTVTVTGGWFDIEWFHTTSLGGQVDVRGTGHLGLYNDNQVVSGTVNVNSDGWYGAEFYGTTTIESTGKINATGANNNYDVEFNGPLNNKGTITVSSNTTVIVSNVGFASQNSGTIEVNGTLDLSGTKLVNTGTITGSGTIAGSLGEDTTSYDEQNGLEYVTVNYEDATPSNYSRNKFTKDPEKTVQVILYKASLSNEQGGTCSVTENFEDYPEN